MTRLVKKPKKHKITPLERALNRIYRLHDKEIDLNLDRVHRLLYDLGNPQENIPPVIHIAGTNGKGSTLAYIQAILEQSNYSVHKHTSPHLLRFNERIILNGKEIEDDQLLDLINFVGKKNNKKPVTFFEFGMAMVFYTFSQIPSDIVLLETGLGGIRDASNVIKSPMATIITTIGMDHMRFLGNTVEEIALKKAGIMKPGTPCFIGKQNHEQLYDIFWEESIAKDVPLYIYGKDWKTQRTNSGFDLTISDKTLHLPLPSLFGDHQIDNAALAIACLHYLDELDISDNNIAAGITNTAWPARMQYITEGYLPLLLQNGAELWLDGSHNKDGAQAIAQILQTWQKEGHDIHIIFGALETRDPLDLLSPLLPYVDQLNTLSFDYPKARNAKKTTELLQENNIQSIPYDNIENALVAINTQTTDKSKILICGSLYLAGKILETNALPPLA